MMERGETMTHDQQAGTLETSERKISDLMNAKRRCLEIGWLLGMLSMLPGKSSLINYRRCSETTRAKLILL